MEYSEEFEREIEEVEDTAIHLATCEAAGQIDVQQRRQLAAQMSHVVDAFPVSRETVARHVEEVERVWTTRENPNTASKHVDTVRRAFLSEVCDEYEPQY